MDDPRRPRTTKTSSNWGIQKGFWPIDADHFARAVENWADGFGNTTKPTEHLFQEDVLVQVIFQKASRMAL
ncbi:hypothetical protein [Maribacter sp. 2307ULW6-5]|uniref:hypothetical protein n=1 Tax=Maribacter sp. 2307ULW6-5 TaxID=3386275 RepID=UPI0039BC6961